MSIGKKLKSKRTPVRLRHKIEKASSAKQAKQRKLAKKDPTWRTRLKKDPGIPNLFPYKDRILKQIEDGKKRKEEEAAQRREQAKAIKRGTTATGLVGDAAIVEEDDSDALLDLEEEDGDEAMGDVSQACSRSSTDTDMQQDSSNPMAALLASARARAADYDPANASDAEEMEEDDEWDADSYTSLSPEPTTKSSKPKDTSRRAYAKTLENLIASSDIILYVLDARDPQSTRSGSVEQSITTNPDKRIILILNKIDLVPGDVLKDWLIHLRRSFPTLPLRSSSSAPSAKTFDHKKLTPAFTANTLIKALKAYSTSRASTTVGIIGYPNVGKSSVINSLTSRLSGKAPNSRSHRECPVGAEAGITTALREVKLDNKIKLIDSPGVVFPITSATMQGNGKLVTAPKAGKSDVDEQARLVLLNAIPPREISDPQPAVSLLLRRLGQDEELLRRMLDVYGLPPLMTRGDSKDMTTDFLVQVARKRGRLGRGGVPNLHASAQTVISDWRDGRIQGWVQAPKLAEEIVNAGRSADEKVIVTEWAKEFKLEGLWGDSADADAAGDGQDVAMAT